MFRGRGSRSLAKACSPAGLFPERRHTKSALIKACAEFLLWVVNRRRTSCLAAAGASQKPAAVACGHGFGFGLKPPPNPLSYLLEIGVVLRTDPSNSITKIH
jgi:hypothetical protein